ncbi:MAG: hypothetical protein K8I29_07470 [Alphaproteobacteria bacterium]|uniref:Cytochrome c7-like domain-containing protein n=1 Tax=Candidatus Nitrobium versatile TaxID=2884831 RepID=A0A953JCE1_9BACT|nr:hypothetical protein [Candidatus Nitrobium versatile]
MGNRCFHSGKYMIPLSYSALSPDIPTAEKREKMKKDYAKMKMVEIIKGKHCGECHNGKRAFSSGKAEDCAKCHKM